MCYVALLSLLSNIADRSSLLSVSQLDHAWAVANSVQTTDGLFEAVRWIVLGVAICSGWGVLQLALKELHIAYPAYLFNTSVGLSANYLSAQRFGQFRVGSVTTEPSVLAHNIILGLALVAGWQDRRVGRYRMIAASIMLIALLGSGSTTGFIGAIVVGFGLVSRLGERGRRYIFLSLAAASTVLFLSPRVRNLALQGTVQKSSSYSYSDRTSATSRALRVFLDRPILGAGMGTARAHDLVVRILSNLGVLGLLAFCVCFARLHNAVKSSASSSIAATLPPLGLAFTAYVVMDAIAGWSYTFGEFWLIGGLIIGMGAIVDGMLTTVSSPSPSTAARKATRATVSGDQRNSPVVLKAKAPRRVGYR
jgi:hypothetical protein